MVKEFFPSGEICASVQLNIDPENENHRVGAASMLNEIFMLVEKWQVKLSQQMSVNVTHEKRVVHRGRPPTPKKGIRERSEKLDGQNARRDGRKPAITLDLCEKHDWNMDKVCEILKITRPALYCRLQRFERDGYIKRDKGRHTEWRDAERRDRS